MPQVFSLADARDVVHFFAIVALERAGVLLSTLAALAKEPERLVAFTVSRSPYPEFKGAPARARAMAKRG